MLHVFQFLHVLVNTHFLFFFFFLMVAILTGVMWYLIAVLTYIFLTISEMSAIAQ